MEDSQNLLPSLPANQASAIYTMIDLLLTVSLLIGLVAIVMRSFLIAFAYIEDNQFKIRLGYKNLLSSLLITVAVFALKAYGAYYMENVISVPNASSVDQIPNTPSVDQIPSEQLSVNIDWKPISWAVAIIALIVLIVYAVILFTELANNSRIKREELKRQELSIRAEKMLESEIFSSVSGEVNDAFILEEVLRREYADLLRFSDDPTAIRLEGRLTELRQTAEKRKARELSEYRSKQAQPALEQINKALELLGSSDPDLQKKAKKRSKWRLN